MISAVLNPRTIKYGITGLSAVVADYSSFVILNAVLHTPLLFTTIASLVAGFIVSFSLNKLWVFGAKAESAHRSTIVQLLMYSLLFIVNTAFTYYFIDIAHKKFGISVYLAKAICICLVMIWNYVIYREIIFKLTNDTRETDT